MGILVFLHVKRFLHLQDYVLRVEFLPMTW